MMCGNCRLGDSSGWNEKRRLAAIWKSTLDCEGFNDS